MIIPIGNELHFLVLSPGWVVCSCPPHASWSWRWLPRRAPAWRRWWAPWRLGWTTGGGRAREKCHVYGRWKNETWWNTRKNDGELREMLGFDWVLGIFNKQN
jgi:hypothetical protein